MTDASSQPPLLKVESLSITFYTSSGPQLCLHPLSFSVYAGESLALFGPSGSGKSLTALALTHLLPDMPQCKLSGAVYYKGKNLLALSPKALRPIRGREIAYVFQEPGCAFNPAYTIGFQIRESLRLVRPKIKSDLSALCDCLREVGIQDPLSVARAYPHTLSAGTLQRALLAMALASQPQLLIADEPTTSLDPPTQYALMEQLDALRRKHRLSLILITHQRGIVEHFADRILTLEDGRLQHFGSIQDVLPRL